MTAKSGETERSKSKPKLLFVLNSADYFLSHRLALAERAVQAGYDVHVAAPPSSAVALIQAEGFTFHSISLSRRGKNPFAEASSIKSLINLYRTIVPDIVHHLTIKPMLYGGIAARRTKVPAVVYAVTGLGYVFIAQGIRATFLALGVQAGYKMIFRHPNHRVVFQNPDDLDHFLSRGIVSKDSVRLIKSSGVDVTRFKPLSEVEGPPLVILASRMLWDKGVGEFVEAARSLRKCGVEARFALVGNIDPGNPSGISKEQLQTWTKEGVVQWWGHQKDMLEIFRQAHIVCLPSYREGAPRILLEASACARPIVTTDVPGCREVVRHGVNGLLVPVRDDTALAASLRILIEDAGIRARMGAAGRKIAVEEFSEDRIILETLRLYEELMNASNGGR